MDNLSTAQAAGNGGESLARALRGMRPVAEACSPAPSPSPLPPPSAARPPQNNLLTKQVSMQVPPPLRSDPPPNYQPHTPTHPLTARTPPQNASSPRTKRPNRAPDAAAACAALAAVALFLALSICRKRSQTRTSATPEELSVEMTVKLRILSAELAVRGMSRPQAHSQPTTGLTCMVKSMTGVGSEWSSH